MIRLPIRPDGKWTVSNKSDKLPDLNATRNLSFDKSGYIRLSKPTVAFENETDNADFGVPVGFAEVYGGAYIVCTTEKQFQLDLRGSGFTGGLVNVTVDTATNTPDNTDANDDPDMVFYNDSIAYVNPADRKIYTHPLGSFSNSWTVHDTSAIVQETTGNLTLCNFQNQVRIAVGNGEKVDQLNTSYASSGNELVISDDYTITGVAYNNNLLGITTHHKKNSMRCMFYVWDGETAGANYVVEVPSYTCYSPTAYRGTFVFLDGNGVLQYWTPTGLIAMTQLPVADGGASFSIGGGNNNMNHSVITDGDLIHINIKSRFSAPNSDNAYYSEQQSGGVWTYDPEVGLYHRHATTGTKVVVDTIATTAVDTSTDQITVTSAEETGTPVRYSDGNGTAITGLVNRTLYYVIKVDATNIQLASTYANAIAGTEIDLTGTGNNNQTLQQYPKRDFGQPYTGTQQGAIHIERGKTETDNTYFYDLFYGGAVALNNTTEVDVGGFNLQDSENRGYFITSKIMSQGLADTWQRLYIKHGGLTKDLDKIIVKYRTDNDKPITSIKVLATDGLITWTDNNTFTTTDTQWADVLAGDEVDIIQGTGAGYLAHVSSISEAGGTYTVNIDEEIKNLTASETGRAVVSRWKKLNTFTKDSLPNDLGYFEVSLDFGASKQIQFKVELRGEDIEVEELLLANKLFKPAG